MNNKNQKEKVEDSYVPFSGGIISKREAKRIGFGLIFGLVGIAVALVLPISKTGLVSYLIIALFLFVGYFIISPLLFKSDDKEKFSMKM